MLTATLEVYQNASFRVAITLSDALGPVDALEAWRFKAQVRPASDAALLVSFRIAVVGREITLSLRPEDTAKLSDSAAWDLIGRAPDGTVYRLAEGDITLYPGITELPL